MIRITQNSGCTIDFAVKNLKEIQEPYYLFNAIGKGVDNNFIINLTDISDVDSPYVKLNFNLNQLPGEYIIDLYEQNDVNNTSLNNAGKRLTTDNLIIE